MQLEHMLGFTPKHLPYYQLALMHRSKIEELAHNNERLEFLGDAVLGAIVAEYLFKKYPYQPEGYLTELRSRIVRRETLNNVAMRMGLQKMVQYNQNDKGLSRSHIFGNALEALNRIDTTASLAEATRLSAQPAKGKLASALKNVMASRNREAALKVLSDFEAMPLGQPKFQALGGVFELVQSTTDLEIFKRGIDDILALGAAIPEQFREQAMGQIYTGLREIQKGKTEDGLPDHAAYLDTKIPKEKAPGL